MIEYDYKEHSVALTLATNNLDIIKLDVMRVINITSFDCSCVRTRTITMVRSFSLFLYRELVHYCEKMEEEYEKMILSNSTEEELTILLALLPFS